MTPDSIPPGSVVSEPQRLLLSYAERGPHPVGLVTIDVVDPHNDGRILPTDVWFPADPSFKGRDLDPAQSPDHPLAQPHHALVGATPAQAAFPLLVFSHGNSGLRRQSTFLTTHLASWGFVVAAPDHLGNTFVEMQGLDEERRKSVHLEARRNRPRDLCAVIDTLARTGGGLPRVLPSHIGAFGHSFGGWTALKTPGVEERIAAVCGLAPVAEPFVGRKAFEPGELPLRRHVATLLLAGIDDVLVDVDKSVRSIFERLGEPRGFIGIEGADHFHFCDGIELLHLMHVSTPREGLTRPLRPYGETIAQDRMHRILQAVVTDFFTTALADGRGMPDHSAETLTRFDPAVRRLA